MKKSLLLAAALLLASVATQAQHKMWVSGTASTSSTTDSFGSSDDKSSSSVFGPSFGYNLNDTWTVGLNVRYSTDVFDPDGGDKETITGLLIGPFARYNKKVDEKVNFYGEVGLNFASAKDKIENQGEAKVSGIQFRVAPGIQYFFTDRWSMNAEWAILSYSTSKVKDSDPEQKTSTFDLGVDFTALSFGLNYHFGGSK